jgi:hypothetical protein
MIKMSSSSGSYNRSKSNSAESNALNAMMANMLEVSPNQGGIQDGAAHSAKTFSSVNKKDSIKNSLNKEELEQSHALKSWGDNDEDPLSSVNSPPMTKPTNRKRHSKRRSKKRSPKTSRGKILLKPHGEPSPPVKNSKRNRKSTKVTPQRVEINSGKKQQEVDLHHIIQHTSKLQTEKANIKSIAKFLKLTHGVQDVASGRHPVTAVAFESHGNRMFVATAQGEATVWPSASIGNRGEEIVCKPQPRAKVTTCHFEGGKVATGYNDGTCVVFNADSGTKIMESSPHHQSRDQRNPGKVTTCSISEDGTTIMLGGGGYNHNDRCGWLYIRDIKTGKCISLYIGNFLFTKF